MRPSFTTTVVAKRLFASTVAILPFRRIRSTLLSRAKARGITATPSTAQPAETNERLDAFLNMQNLARDWTNPSNLRAGVAKGKMSARMCLVTNGHHDHPRDAIYTAQVARIAVRSLTALSCGR